MRAPQLVVALDVDELEQAAELIDQLGSLGVLFKMGYEAIYNFGLSEIARIVQRNRVGIFADVKLHDIPRTVAAAIRGFVGPNVRIVNVHALGGTEMMRAAVTAVHERADEISVAPPLVLAVTILTSLDSQATSEIGLGEDVEGSVMRLATLAKDSGCDGVVASADEVPALKLRFGAGFVALSPGIRPSGAPSGDQRRVATPREAVAAGADYLVVGRPITEADDPRAAAEMILEEMASVGR